MFTENVPHEFAAASFCLALLALLVIECRVLLSIEPNINLFITLQRFSSVKIRAHTDQLTLFILFDGQGTQKDAFIRRLPEASLY